MIPLILTLAALFTIGAVGLSIEQSRERRELLRKLKCRAAGERLERQIRVMR